MIGLEIERPSIGGDRRLIAIERGEREAEVVAELRFLRYERNGSLEQRQRFRRPAALMERNAEIMKRERLLGVDAERVAIRALGGIEIAALMRRHTLRCERRRR